MHVDGSTQHALVVHNDASLCELPCSPVDGAPGIQIASALQRDPVATLASALRTRSSRRLGACRPANTDTPALPSYPQRKYR